MKVKVNTKEYQIANETTVRELLDNLNYKNAAVIINGQKLLMSQYDNWELRELDIIKIIRILGGG